MRFCSQAVNAPPLARSYGTCNFLDRANPSCCVLLLEQPQCYVTAPYCMHTGEARTSAFVERNGGADASFDSFSFDTAASEILLGLVDTYLPPGGEGAEGARRGAATAVQPAGGCLKDSVLGSGNRDDRSVAEWTETD